MESSNLYKGKGKEKGHSPKLLVIYKSFSLYMFETSRIPRLKTREGIILKNYFVFMCVNPTQEKCESDRAISTRYLNSEVS